MIDEIGTHPKDGKPLLLVETQDEWRAWLEGNHEESSGVWLVSWKKATGKPFIPFMDAVDEALCYRVGGLEDQQAGRGAGDAFVHAEEPQESVVTNQ